MKEPVVDKDKCSGAAVCVGLAPEVFELNDKGKAEITDPEGADEDTIQQAIDGCPVDAISWKE